MTSEDIFEGKIMLNFRTLYLLDWSSYMKSNVIFRIFIKIFINQMYVLIKYEAIFEFRVLGHSLVKLYSAFMYFQLKFYKSFHIHLNFIIRRTWRTIWVTDFKIYLLCLWIKIKSIVIFSILVKSFIMCNMFDLMINRYLGYAF